jgi:uncharacterized protein YdhG (YjbR/CyaY superfamily)
MDAERPAPTTVDDYVAGFPPEVRAILQEIRQRVRAALPEAREAISYRMPAFMLQGVVVYFAAFKRHIGLYPPVTGDADLEEAVAPYAGEKGNLRFPLGEPIPYDLIVRIARHRASQNRAKAAARRRKSG